MKFLKKNSSAIVAILVFIIVLVGIFAVKKVFLTDEGAAIYGSRLEGRSKVEISNDTKNKVQEKAKEDSSNVSVRVAGRIVNIYIKVNAETTLEKAKSLGDKVLEPFSKEEKEYYDFQILIENDKNPNQFPIIGYKHHAKEKITWTKDRTGN